MPIRFLGVWDTVGALGIPDDMALLNLIDGFKDHSFHDTDLGDAIQTARHAVALDEYRASFQPTLWTNVAADRDVEQIWFPGAHGDVGGGYGHSGLSDGALLWMIAAARGERRPAADPVGAPGLGFHDRLLRQIRPSHHGILHDSLTGPFALLPTKPRSAPSLDGGTDIHPSAAERHVDPPITQAPYRPTRRLAPGEATTLDVFAIRPWNDTGLFLEAGVPYTLTAAGEWVDGSITCGPAGTDDGRFQMGEVAQLFGSVLGQAEELFKRLSGNQNADFLMTKRHEPFPWFCLVGAVANGIGVTAAGEPMPHETVRIGDGCRWTPEQSGYLYAYANDAWRFYGNNKGRVRLTVERA